MTQEFLSSFLKTFVELRECIKRLPRSWDAKGNLKTAVGFSQHKSGSLDDFPPNKKAFADLETCPSHKGIIGSTSLIGRKASVNIRPNDNETVFTKYNSKLISLFTPIQFTSNVAYIQQYLGSEILPVVRK